jgi:hypothetical protein
MKHSKLNVQQAIISDDTLEEIAYAMVRSCPPSQKWWQTHYALLHGAHFAGVMIDPNVDCFNLDTKFMSHWTLIKLTFHFILGYKKFKYSTKERSEMYMEAMKGLLQRIQSVCDEEPKEDYPVVLSEITEQFEYLAHFAEHGLGKRMDNGDEALVRRIVYKCLSVGKEVYICISKPFRMKKDRFRRFKSP